MCRQEDRAETAGPDDLAEDIVAQQGLQAAEGHGTRQHAAGRGIARSAGFVAARDGPECHYRIAIAGAVTAVAGHAAFASPPRKPGHLPHPSLGDARRPCAQRPGQEGRRGADLLGPATGGRQAYRRPAAHKPAR
eukprot:scaffold20418_cov112-Isochrysis_galbana.AAC.1